MSECRPDQFQQPQPETRIEPALVKKLLFPRDSKVRIQNEALEAASYLIEQFIMEARERASIDAEFDTENDDIIDDEDNDDSSNDNNGRRNKSGKSLTKRKRSVGGVGSIIDIDNIDEEFNTDISSDGVGDEESNSDANDPGNKKRSDGCEAKRVRKDDKSTSIFIRPKHVMNIAAELLLDLT